MIVEQSNTLEQSQRVQVEIETQGSGKCVKIRVESHDPCLGWYTSGSLGLPLHQLPLLEQAVRQLGCQAVSEDSGGTPHRGRPQGRKIIPFPGLRSSAVAE
jgi:hypothetical protein